MRLGIFARKATPLPIPTRELATPCARAPKEENSMTELPWVLAAILAIMIVEIVIAFALECVRQKVE